MTVHQYVGILLAAGAGTRYRAALPPTPDHDIHKLLARLPDGTYVAEASARRLLSAVPKTLAVVFDTPLAVSQILSDLGCDILRAPASPRGMGVSLAAAAQHLLASTDAASRPGCVVALADMPWVRTQTLHTLLQHAAHDRIVVPTFNGRRGHPVVFGAQFLPELATLQGDTGARALLMRYGADEVACDDPGVIRDIDTPDDLR